MLRMTGHAAGLPGPRGKRSESGRGKDRYFQTAGRSFHVAGSDALGAGWAIGAGGLPRFTAADLEPAAELEMMTRGAAHCSRGQPGTRIFQMLDGPRRLAPRRKAVASRGGGAGAGAATMRRIIDVLGGRGSAPPTSPAALRGLAQNVVMSDWGADPEGNAGERGSRFRKKGVYIRIYADGEIRCEAGTKKKSLKGYLQQSRRKTRKPSPRTVGWRTGDLGGSPPTAGYACGRAQGMSFRGRRRGKTSLPPSGGRSCSRIPRSRLGRRWSACTTLAFLGEVPAPYAQTLKSGFSAERKGRIDRSGAKERLARTSAWPARVYLADREGLESIGHDRRAERCRNDEAPRSTRAGVQLS